MFYLCSGKLKIAQEFRVFDFQSYYTNSPWRVNRKVHCSQSPNFSKNRRHRKLSVTRAAILVSNAQQGRTLGFIAVGVERRKKFLQNNQTFTVSLRRNVLYFGICFSLVFCVSQVNLHKSNFVVRIYHKRSASGIWSHGCTCEI